MNTFDDVGDFKANNKIKGTVFYIVKIKMHGKYPRRIPKVIVMHNKIVIKGKKNLTSIVYMVSLLNFKSNWKVINGNDDYN